MNLTRKKDGNGRITSSEDRLRGKTDFKKMLLQDIDKVGSISLPKKEENYDYSIKRSISRAFPVDNSLLDRMIQIIDKRLYQATSMIEKDSRLDSPDKDKVVSKVKARLPEVGKNGLTLGDIVKKEADKLLAEKAKALTVPLQIDAEAAIRILHTHQKEMGLAYYDKAPTVTEPEVVAAIKAIPKTKLNEKMNPNHKPESQLWYAETIRECLQSFADGMSEYKSVRDAAKAKLSE